MIRLASTKARPQMAGVRTKVAAITMCARLQVPQAIRVPIMTYRAALNGIVTKVRAVARRPVLNATVASNLKWFGDVRMLGRHRQCNWSSLDCVCHCGARLVKGRD